MPGLELAVGRPSFDMWCALPPGAAPTVGRFIVGARGATLRYLVKEGPPAGRWLEFEDQVTCDEGSRVEVQIETRLTTNGQLIFTTTASGEGCQPTHAVRPPKPFAAETWPPHILCCSDGPKRNGEE
jgi:hypothetical protein